MLRASRQNKYGAKRTVVDGITFDSMGQAARYRVLKADQDRGVICDLECEPEWPLDVNGIRIGKFKADFRYKTLPSRSVVVEDFKSGPTRTTSYRLRIRLLKAIHDVDVFEVDAKGRMSLAWAPPKKKPRALRNMGVLPQQGRGK